MSKEKLATIKNKIKTCAPIIAAASIATIATVVYYKTKLSLDVTKEDLEAVQTGHTNMTYSIDGNDYALSYRGKTPSN